MNNSGWIKLHRKLINWEWYDDANTFRLFIHLMLTVNHKDNKYKGVVIKKGCTMTGQDKLSAELGISRQSIRTSLNNLKSTNDITIKSNRKGSIIQVVNYDKYQVVTNEVTNNQPTEQPQLNQQLTSNKNDKKEKEVYRSFAHLSLSTKEFNSISETYSKDQIDSILDSIENYKRNDKYTSLNLTARKWLKKEYPNGKEQKTKIAGQEYYEHVMKQINLKK